MPVNKKFRAVLDITNRTPFVLNSAGPYPVHIGYHWMRSEGEMVIYDGARSRLLPLLVPSARHCFDAKVLSPSSPGQYTLRFTLVQEGVQWFDGPEIGAMADVPVHITS
jgi:hypothetical protein